MAGNMNWLDTVRIAMDGTAVNYDYVTTRGFEITDVIAHGVNTVGAATAQLNRATAAAPTVFNTISSVLAVDTEDDIEYTTVITTAQQTLGTGDVLRVVTANVPIGDVFVDLIPATWIAG